MCSKNEIQVKIENQAKLVVWDLYISVSRNDFYTFIDAFGTINLSPFQSVHNQTFMDAIYSVNQTWSYSV